MINFILCWMSYTNGIDGIDRIELTGQSPLESGLLVVKFEKIVVNTKNWIQLGSMKLSITITTL